MSPDYFYGTTRKRATKQVAKPRPNETRGKPATGKIAKLLFGQAYGFIKMRDNREATSTARMSRKGPRSTTSRSAKPSSSSCSTTR